jgi:hypothetical protein
MKKYLIQATCVFAFSGISCWADALHGYCAGPSQCIDNGNNSPSTSNPATDFGFTVNGGGNGNLLLEILIPNNYDPNPSTWSFDLIGTAVNTATLFSTTPWTNGFLDTYLGIHASPSNPIGAYLGTDPGATGFFVYQANFANVTLPTVSHPNTLFQENFAAGDPALPIGSYITGFFNNGSANRPHWVATANSGAIFEETGPVDDAGIAPAPEPSSIVLLGFAVLGLGAFLKRRASSRA